MSRLRTLVSPLNLGRLILLVVLLLTLREMDGFHPPRKAGWEKHKAQGREATFEEYVTTGLWYGAAARAGICGVLLVVSLAWGIKRDGGAPMRLTLQRDGDPVVTPKVQAVVLGVIVLAALGMRLPRMTHSFWGDEADAMATYVHGNYRLEDLKDPAGKMYFQQPSWQQTFFGARHGANNHVLFSVTSRASLEVWRKITGQPETAFTEWVARMPVLLAGLGSLVTTALLLKRWGAPALGLVTAAMLAVHPWHVRYTTEARGYGIMLLLLPLFLICLTDALEKNRWRDWLGVAVYEFLLMYAWPGIMYPLAAVNAAAALLMVLRADRLPMLTRWVTANLAAAAVFASLYMPHIPQIENARHRLLWIKGLPMNEVWFHNLLTQPFTGIPYHEMVKNNPSEMSWQRMYAHAPVLTAVGFTVLLLAFAIGFVLMWRRSRPIALLVTGVFGSAVVCTLHFKFVLQDELRAWYLIFTMPLVCACVGLGWLAVSALAVKRWTMPGTGVGGRPLLARAAIVVAFLGLFAGSVWPMNASLINEPEEDYKGAAAMSVLSHEEFSPDKPPGCYSIWLWRYSALYDPRGDMRARDKTALQQYMDKARSTGRELYVIVGYRELAKNNSGDFLAVVDDPARFEKLADFHSRESLHTLEVFRMKAVPPAGPP